MKINLIVHRGGAVSSESTMSAGRPGDCGLIPERGGDEAFIECLNIWIGSAGN